MVHGFAIPLSPHSRSPHFLGTSAVAHAPFFLTGRLLASVCGRRIPGIPSCRRRFPRSVFRGHVFAFWCSVLSSVDSVETCWPNFPSFAPCIFQSEFAISRASRMLHPAKRSVRCDAEFEAGQPIDQWRELLAPSGNHGRLLQSEEGRGGCREVIREEYFKGAPHGGFLDAWGKAWGNVVLIADLATGNISTRTCH